MRSVGQTIKNGSLKIESVHKRSYIYYYIAGQPKPSKDYLLEKNISRFEYRFGSIILFDTH